MNAIAFIVVGWFAVGVFMAIFSSWYMKTHEKQWVDETLEGQIFRCIPPPIKWGVLLIMLFCGPLVLLWSIYDAIQKPRKEKGENDVPGGRAVAPSAPDMDPQVGYMVFFGVLGAALTAWIWASAHPAKPYDKFMEDQARTIGFWLFIFVLPGALVNPKKAFQGLRFPLLLLPLYLVAEVFPAIVSMTVGWDGGWMLGLTGAATGAVVWAAVGKLFVRWELPENQNYPSERTRTITLPIAFAVLFACFGAYNWASAWLTLDQAWAIVLFPLVFAFLGALVGRPLLSMLAASPLVLVHLVPLIATLTVGWAGGWPLGIAGAVAGMVAGAANGWMYNRWIMPEYDKLREREKAGRPPGSTDGTR
jgi:hypothetical protein